MSELHIGYFDVNYYCIVNYYSLLFTITLAFSDNMNPIIIDITFHPVHYINIGLCCAVSSSSNISYREAVQQGRGLQCCGFEHKQ